jgi:signal transduction histidine kinase
MEPVEYSFRIGGPDERVRWIESVSFPILDPFGDVDAVGGISRDVTERVEREQRLKARVEQLDQASSFISHDLRNLLNVAEGNLSLYRDTDDPATLKSVGNALERMKEVITDMLQLVELDPSPTELVRRPISGPVRAAWETVDTRESRLEIVEDGEFEMSESHVQSMFENLVRNAVGHGGADVTVRVGTLPDGFYVEDTGTGIPPDDREQVFEHGFSTGYGGTGTGLTIVKRIAEQHGWTVRVTEGEEGGARFEFGTDNGPDTAPGLTA